MLPFSHSPHPLFLRLLLLYPAYSSEQGKSHDIIFIFSGFATHFFPFA